MRRRISPEYQALFNEIKKSRGATLSDKIVETEEKLKKENAKRKLESKKLTEALNKERKREKHGMNMASKLPQMESAVKKREIRSEELKDIIKPKNEIPRIIKTYIHGSIKIEKIIKVLEDKPSGLSSKNETIIKTLAKLLDDIKNETVTKDEFMDELRTLKSNGDITDGIFKKLKSDGFKKLDKDLIELKNYDLLSAEEKVLKKTKDDVNILENEIEEGRKWNRKIIRNEKGEETFQISDELLRSRQVQQAIAEELTAKAHKPIDLNNPASNPFSMEPLPTKEATVGR
jgi:hypothetical protein